MINTATVAGRLTADPVIRTADGGNEFVSLRIAIDNGKDANGTARPATFIDGNLSGKQFPDFMRTSVKKGTPIAMSGRFETQERQDKNGKPVMFGALRVAELELLNDTRANLNAVTIQGRLVADPEIRQTTDGKKVTTVRLAVENPFKRKDGTKHVTYLNVSCWNQQAEFVSTYFRKGDMLMVNGRLKPRQYETKEGEKRTSYDILAVEVTSAGKKKDAAAAAQQPATSANTPAAETTTAPTYGAGAYDMADFTAIDDADDLPF